MFDEDCNRGKIRNRDNAKQLRDFSGLRFGKITPTDIDGFLDFGGEVFVFFELKHGTSKMPTGQKLAYERIVDACEKGGVCTLFILAHHNTDKESDVDVSTLNVTEYYSDGVWFKPECEITVRESVRLFLRKIKTTMPCQRYAFKKHKGGVA